jgi:hypothetical protein
MDAITLFKGVPRDKAKAIICPMISDYYVAKGAKDCGFVDGKWEHPMCAAKTKANRLLRVIEGESSPKTSPKTLEKLPKGTVEAIQAALAGLTKAQVNAALAQAKAGLSFE